MNFKLLQAIRESGLRQRDFARLVEDHESIVSRIVNGIWNPDEKRKMRYARALGKCPKELFSDGMNKKSE
jgi:hypothetical protein